MMWTKITDDLPPVGKEVLFITVREGEKTLGRIEECKDLRTGKMVPNVSLKSFSLTFGITNEHQELDVVSHWAEIPEDQPEEVINRFELMEMEE